MMFSDYYVYDIENYCNVFTMTVKRDSDNALWIFEISNRVNDGYKIYNFVLQVANSNAAMVGYNNLFYDYPILHMIMITRGCINNATLFSKGLKIINDNNKYNHYVYYNKRFCAQIDLMSIHHFDSNAKFTSLKLLEFNMRMCNIQELPFDPHKPLTVKQIEKLLSYNKHDVDATALFLQYTKSMINFRLELIKKFNRPDFLNYNDTKIGEQITVETLKKSGVTLQKGDCTIRNSIPLKDVIFPYIKFKTKPFRNILNYLKNTTLDPNNLSKTLLNQTISYDMALSSDPNTIWCELENGKANWLSKLDKDINENTTFSFKYVKDQKTNINVIIDSFQFNIGCGGIHGSVHNDILYSTNDRILRDTDAASYYPNIGIQNKIFPKHIGIAWCNANEYMYRERLRVGKKTDLGAGIKLALNGGYGKTKDVYSVLYDPQYTMSVTINGQLLLLMLAEKLMSEIPEFRMIQINTDGLTYDFPKKHENKVCEIMDWWENLTNIELEHVDYRLMAIRDVNNYIAVTKPVFKNNVLKPAYIKRIGCYAYLRPDIVDGEIINAQTREVPFHKNHSAIIIAKAAEAALIRNENIRDFIVRHVKTDPYDFFIRAKINKNCHLYSVDNDTSIELPRTTRFYISNSGAQLIKTMPPTEKKCIEWLTKPHWKHVDTGETKQAKSAPSGKWKRCKPPTFEPPITRSVLQGTKGFNVTICNTLDDNLLALPNINIEYYVEQTRKIVDDLL